METLTRAPARTPLHHWHVAHGARIADRDGWKIPFSYSSVDQEVAAVRAGLGLVDVSAFAKISFRGRGVATLAHVLVGDSPASKPGGVTALGCFKKGTVPLPSCDNHGFAARPKGAVPILKQTDDASSPVLACRLTEDHLLLFALTTNAAALPDRLATLRQELPIVENDESCAYAAFCLLGGPIENVLRRLTALDVGRSAFPAGWCAETSLAGVHALLVRPLGVALNTVYVAVAWDLAEYVWERLRYAARTSEIEPVGLEAWHKLMSEAATVVAASVRSP